MSAEITIINEILSTVLSALPKLVELFKKRGGRDAFLVAVDSTLATARAVNDADFEAKIAEMAAAGKGFV